CQDVRNTGTFKNSTHATSRNYSSTCSSGFYQYLCRSFFRPLVVRNSSMHYRHLNKILLRILNTLCNCFLHFFRFSEPMSHYTVFIPHYNKSRKTKCATSLCGFHHTVDSNDFLF